MNRPSRIFALLALATSIAACSVGSPEAVASPTVAGSPSASPAEAPSPAEPTPDVATVLAADGLGPYVVGASLSDLESRGLVANIEPSFHCDDSWQGAEATGRHAGELTVSFYMGRLSHVHTHSTEFVTPSGAHFGMPLTELQDIYRDRGTIITGWMGNEAVSVRVPNTELGIVFYLDEANTNVRSISAGTVEPLEDLARNGEGC